MRELIEARLRELVPVEGTLLEAAAYSLLAPAKRLRPLLILAGCQSYDVDFQKALDCACALEMIHTYSLIHDDLPSMDNDDMRRGLPTLHKVYGEAIAILAGDYLLTYAFEVLSKAPYLSVEERLLLVQNFAQASGSTGLVAGQVLDLQGHPNTELMHIQKTAALFCCALKCVAILNKGQDSQLLESFGLAFGQLFQLIDDLIDHDHPEGDAKAFEKALIMYQQCEYLLGSLSVPAEPLFGHLYALKDKLFTLQPV